MRQLTGQLHLTLEAAEGCFIGFVGFDELNGNRPLQHGVPCHVDRTHATLADDVPKGV